MKTNQCAIGLALALSALTGYSADSFRLSERTEILPEVGQMKYSVIHCDKWDLTFLRPAGWSLSLNAAEKKATLQSRDFGSTLVMQVRLESPSLGTASNTNDLRSIVTERFQGAKIDEVFSCYASNLSGQAFDLHEDLANNLSGHYRVAFVPFAGGTMEFTLITSNSSVKRAREVFGAFLTSFAITTVQATASTATPP